MMMRSSLISFSPSKLFHSHFCTEARGSDEYCSFLVLLNICEYPSQRFTMWKERQQLEVQLLSRPSPAVQTLSR